MGPSSLRSITVRVRDDASMERAAGAVTDLLTQRHGVKDFFLFNTDSIRKSVESATATMTLINFHQLPSSRSSSVASAS